MTAVQVKITTAEYQDPAFGWYELYADQSALALVDVVADAAFNEISFANAFIHANLTVADTWFYWVRAAYLDRSTGVVTYGALVFLGSITLSGAGGVGDFVGPAGATTGNFVSFADGTGKLGADSGFSDADFDPAGAAAAAQAAAIASANAHSDGNDAVTLAAAETYADGVAATAEANAEAYADGLLGAIDISELLDDLGFDHGDILFRGAFSEGWKVLPAGTPGYLLETGGPGVDPQWVPAPSGGSSSSDSGGGGITANQATDRFTFIFDGAGAVVAAGAEDFVYCPFDCVPVGYVIFGEDVGSAVFDIQVDAFANFPPDGADSIVAADPPTCTASKTAKDLTPTGWSSPIAADTFIRASVTSCTVFEKVRLVLIVEKI